MEQARCCSEESFQALGKKAFRNIPRPLFKLVLRELPDYATVAYLVLYDLAKANLKYPGTVVISYGGLAEELCKSEASVKRAIKVLKEFGYLEVIQKGDEHKNYLPNIFRVRCPEREAKKIIDEVPDRKASIISFPKKLNSKSQPNEHSAYPYNPLKEKTMSNNLSSERFEQNFKAYKEKMTDLIKKGSSPLAASRDAFKIFTEIEAKEIQESFLNKASPGDDFFASRGSNLTRGELKNEPHKNNNNRDHDLLLTIGKSSQDKTESNPVSRNSETIVGLEKETKINILLSEQEKEMIVKKMFAMLRAGEIHPTIKNSYKNKVTILIDEVVYHVIHRDFKKFKTAKHAINACAKLLRQGIWSTPKRLIQQQIRAREEEAWRQKQLEIQSARKIFKNVF